jgi:CTP:molybdopterin cytidylyltransferase MocA
MGEPKALLPWIDGTPIVTYQVRALSEAGYGPIVVVLGHEPDLIRAALPEDVGVIVVVNDRYQDGRSSSIITGVGALGSERVGGVLIASVDQPRSASILRTMLTTWEQHPAAILTPSYRHRAGHPSLFDASLIADLLQVTEERQGLRDVIRTHAASRAFVDIDDPIVLTNLNTPEDYQSALSLARGW